MPENACHRMVRLIMAAACASTVVLAVMPSPSISWWLADYDAGAVSENKAFLASPSLRSAITGVLHCCTGPQMLPNGTIHVNVPQKALFASLVAAERAALPVLAQQPILFSLSPNIDAILSGAAMNAVPTLVALAVDILSDGWVVDYEPRVNQTSAHAARLAAFVLALGTGLRKTSRVVALCVSDWGVLNYYSELSAARADRYLSMSDTYGGKGLAYALESKLAVARMLHAFPPSTVVVGIGTVVPLACRCAYGDTGNCTGDYAWSSDTLSEYLRWLKARGVQHLSVWRADISPLYCKVAGDPLGVRNFMAPAFASFLAGGEDLPEAAD